MKFLLSLLSNDEIGYNALLFVSVGIVPKCQSNRKKFHVFALKCPKNNFGTVFVILFMCRSCYYRQNKRIV